MRTEAELEAKVREIPLGDRLRECHERLGKMCSERRGPKMTIPVQWYDDDFFIGVTLKDALALCIPTPEAVEKARLKLAEAFDVDGQNAEPIRAGVDSETN